MVAGLLAGTVVATLISWSAERADRRNEARATARQLASTAKTTIDAAAAALRGGDVIGRGGKADLGIFRVYARGLLREETITAVAFARRVADADRAAFERRLGGRISQLGAGSTLVVAPRRTSYLPAIALEPNRSPLSQALGYDLNSEARRREAVAHARETVDSVLSAPLALAASGNPGLSLVKAVRSPQGRTVGILAAGVEIGPLETRLADRVNSGAAFAITDGGKPVLGQGDLGDDPARMTVRVAGRPWLVEAARPAASPASALEVAAAGLGLSLLALLSLMLTVRREQSLLAERRRQDTLVRVVEGMERALDVRERLQLVADALVPEVADTCTISLIERADRRQVAHAGTKAESTVEQLTHPLVARDRTLGVLTLARTTRPLREPEKALVRELATHVALSLDNARLLEQQTDVAVTLQRALMPPGLPDVPGAQIAARYVAAEEHMQIGGDFYDVFAGPDGWVVAVGDVSGKGADAAALTALARHDLRARVDVESASQSLVHLNRAILHEAGGTAFCTVATARLQPMQDGFAVTYAGAGHPPAIVLRAAGGHDLLDPTGPLLGVADDAGFSDRTAFLRTGDTLLLYTDGAFEARRNGELFGLERLVGIATDAADLELGGLLDSVQAAIAGFSETARQDDLVLLALRVV